jgi:hypothetical protein
VDRDVGDTLPANAGRVARQALTHGRVKVVTNDAAPVRSSKGNQAGALGRGGVDVVDDDGVPVDERSGD